MVKYSPKDNTYKEMYLINKFEKDIMESSLQNLSNNKNKNQAEKYTSPININVENNKESLENIMSKSTPISESNQKQLFNTGGVINVSEDLDSTISVDNPQNSNLSKDGDSFGESDKNKSSKNDSLLSPSNFKRIIDSKTKSMEKIKSCIHQLTQNTMEFQTVAGTLEYAFLIKTLLQKVIQPPIIA